MYLSFLYLALLITITCGISEHHPANFARVGELYTDESETNQKHVEKLFSDDAENGITQHHFQEYWRDGALPTDDDAISETHPTEFLKDDRQIEDDKCRLPRNTRCYKYRCRISIPNTYQPQSCRKQRLRNIRTNRLFYKLTKYGEKKYIKFPLQAIPFLNQTIDKVRFHTAFDPVDSAWQMKFSVLTGIVGKKFKRQLVKSFQRANFTHEREYIQAYDFHNLQIKALHTSQFSNPSMYPTFTDIIHNQRYKTDDIFVQRRLAGPCPFMLKLVTNEGDKRGFKWSDLTKLLNPGYDFNSALNIALTGEEHITLARAMDEERLYVLYHPENNGLQTIPDFFDRNRTDNHKLFNLTSPITLFARTCEHLDENSGKLKVFAIQLDYKETSKVYSPQSDHFDWSFAKNMVDVTDFNICQGLWHLSHLHISGHVYCALFKSHFGELHPIYQIMQYHCEGTVPHIAMTWPILTTPQSLGQQLFSIGHTGMVNLSISGFKQFRYDLLAFDKLLYAHGLECKKLKYYPFRDDGRVIWNGFKGFAKEFVRRYYRSNRNVRGDRELQSYVNQLSAEGQGEAYGGKANIHGFPNTFRTKKQLETFITRFLWQIALHGAVNYPLEPWASFIPLSPTKLYHNDKLHKSKVLAYAFPDARTTIGAITFAEILGNVRVNRIFDYYDKVRDARLSGLVWKYHTYFHKCIQKILSARNKKRRMKNEMGFQYLEPKWLTNSIHI